MSEEESNTHLHNMVWDTACPARLLILPQRATTTDGESSLAPQQQQVDYLWSHTGCSSCNKHEKTALIKIIQANEAYHEENDKTGLVPCKELLRKCRQALHDCLLEWKPEIEQNVTDSTDKMTAYEKQLEETNKENYELLTVTYSALHLSDVILPLLPTPALTTDYRQDPFGMAGAASANFVRYLRANHMTSAEFIEDDVPAMLQSTQPDQYGDGTLYWRYMETLVVRGLLEKAWNLLERHSQYQSAMTFARTKAQDNNSGIVEIMNQVREDFAVLREVLHRAPLPGGRNDLNDNALVTPQLDNEDMETEFDLKGLDVRPSDFFDWEVDTGGNVGDKPLEFSPELATRRHNTWQIYVKRKVRHQLPTSRRLPEIEKILSILSGDFSQVAFEDWADQLCADLLYRRPDCRPRDLKALVSRAMREFDAQDGPFANTIVQITAGNAGTAISTFYMLGAASGAALSTTLLAVLYCMFLEASIVSSEAAVHKTEFLSEAAVAIVSSLASNESDVGIDLATRLLLPFTMQNDCSLEIMACFSEILEHYNPTSDSSARNIVSRCEKLIVEQKNRRVLESCASVILCRYRSHCSQSSPGAGVAWLLKGVKLEAILTEKAADGSCFRTLAALCYSTSKAILMAMSKKGELDEKVALTVREMASEIDRDGLSTGDDEIKIRELGPVVVFMQTKCMFEAARAGNRTIVPKCIVTCLTKHVEDKSGPPTTFIPLSMQGDLLEIACKLILDHFEETQESGTTSTTCVFEKRGISLLMESLFLLEAHFNDSPVDYVKMKEILLRGLSQAIIAENATKPILRKAKGGLSVTEEAQSSPIRTCSLFDMAPHKQEEVVHRMLDF